MTLTGKVVVAGTATLTGLPATVNISHAESADTLAIDTARRRDTLDTSAFAPGTIGLEVDQSPPADPPAAASRTADRPRPART